jgi:hypothetical protein
LAGSHRAPRGGGRAAAREARRQKARKRNQTIAAGAAVVVLVGGGGVAALNAFGGDNGSGPKAGSGPADDKSAADILADDKALLDPAGAKTLGATGAWTVTRTADGQSAPDNVFACQLQRFADPSGLRTWVRTLQNSVTKETAVQYIDVSNDKATAAKTYTNVVRWLSQCTTPQTRLSAGYSTSGIGEAGVIAVFSQLPGAKTTKYRTVAVTLAGQATMVIEHDTVSATPPRPNAVLATATAAAKKICEQTGGCGTGAPIIKPALLPNADTPGFMAPVDLPLLAQVDKAWVSAPPSAKTTAGTQCERIDLRKAKPAKYGTVTYLTPEAKVPTEFGLDNTVAKFTTAAAAAKFVEQIKKNVDSCEKTVSNADVKSTGTVKTPTVTGKTWKATYDTGNGNEFVYRIGIAQAGDRAIYLLFPVLKKLDLTDDAFNETLVRAADRSVVYK